MSLDRTTPLVATEVPKQPDNVRGLILMALAFFCFAAADAQAKFLTSSFHSMQIAWARQLGLFAGLFVYLAIEGPSLFRTAHPVLQVLRGMIAVISATTFIFALGYVPLADAVAVSFVAPFLVTLFGALILREKVGIRRISAVTVGFIGTLIVIRPGSGALHPAVFLVVLAAAAFAARQIVSRYLAASDRTSTTVAYTACSAILILTIPLPFYWRTPQGFQEFAFLAGMAICAGAGELLVIRALQVAHAIVLAPVHYTLIVWGTFYGWLLFGQFPDGWTWLGTAIIVATGLYIMYRERVVARRARLDRTTT